MDMGPLNAYDRQFLDAGADETRKRNTPGTPFQPLMNGSATEIIQAGSWDDRISIMDLPLTTRLSETIQFEAQIGDMPPQPPTLRGRTGAILVRVVRRMLFWYTAQVQSFQVRIREAAREQVTAFRSIRAAQSAQSRAVAQLSRRVEGLEHDNRWDLLIRQRHTLEEIQQNLQFGLSKTSRQQDDLRQDQKQLREADRALSERVDTVQSGMVAIAGQQDQLKQDQKVLKAVHNALEEHVNTIQSAVDDLRGQLASLDTLHGTHRNEWGQLEKEHEATRTRLSKLERQLEELALDQQRVVRTKTSPNDALPDTGQPVPLESFSGKRSMDALSGAEWQARMEQLFVDHSWAFRGEFHDIKQRLCVYVPYVQEAFAAGGQAPALDLGCGRGEWLEVLREADIPAVGVDLNEKLVGLCRSRGFQAVQSDLFDFLRTAPAKSHSIVTAFHVVEHFSFEGWFEMINQTARLLTSGGMAIFETPNPRNLFVGSHNFYLDPTHRQPLPNEILSFMVNACGLHAVQMLPLHAYPVTMHLAQSDCPAVQFINENFYGPQDYAVIARKP